MSAFPPLELGLAFVAMAAGACIQGSVGFGLALVAAPFLALINPEFIPAPLIVNGLALNLLLLRRQRRDVDLGSVRWAVVGNLGGTVVAALVLLRISPEGFSMLFGCLVLLAVLVSAVGLRFRVGRRAAVVAGVFSGFMGTTSTIGGPPVALIYQDQPGGRLRGTLSAYFSVSCVLALIALTAVGRFGGSELQLAMALLPGLLVGFVLSTYTVRLLDRGGTRPLILVLSGLAGVSVLMRQLL